MKRRPCRKAMEMAIRRAWCVQQSYKQRPELHCAGRTRAPKKGWISNSGWAAALAK